MVFGTPGGDAQEQWTSQFFLNYIDFGMDIQEALDAPTVHSVHFPSSFYPRPAYPARVVAESRMSQPGHRQPASKGTRSPNDRRWANGKVMAIRLDKERGVMHGGVSPKGNIGYACRLVETGSQEKQRHDFPQIDIRLQPGRGRLLERG